MQNVLRRRPDDKTDDQKRKQNALGRNNRRERDVLRDCFRLGKDTIDAPVLSAKTRERVGMCEFGAN